MKAVGIDLGTTNSVVSVLEAGEPVTVTNAEGSRLTPSVVAYTADGQVLVGEAARRQAVTNPTMTFSAVKRRMGTDWSVKVGDRVLTAADISAEILRKLKADAESYLGHPVSKAVITVPARFDDAQRQATKLAGELAGFEVLRLVAEPTSASFAHGLDRRPESTVMVFDLGGGTFDVAVLKISSGLFDVRATAGDTNLGGVDFDRAVVDWLLAELADAEGVDVSDDPVAMQRLWDAAEQAKIELSNVTQTTINLPFLTASAPDTPVHLSRTLTRERFDELTAPLVARLKAPFTRVLADAGVTVSELDDVLLVGGSTRIPAVQALVGRLTGGRQPHRGVNPDEAVAQGAALNAGVIQGDVKDVLLLDVTPLSLGIETRGGVSYRLIDRNTTIPTRRSEMFTTAVDNQTAVEIHVVQGERPMVADNVTLGRFTLNDIRPAPRGVPQIEVTFDIDADGIMHVSAVETSTGERESLLITGGSRLHRDTVERMLVDAAANREFDRHTATQARLRVQAESLAHQTAKTLSRYGAAIDPAVYATVSNALNTLRSAVAGDSDTSLRAAMAQLRELGPRLSTAIMAAEERR